MAIRKRNAQAGTTLASHGNAILKDAHRELKDPARRLLGKRILSLGGLALLSGCDLSTDKSVNTMLRKISFFNDDVQALLFDPNHMAPTYPESMITRPFPFNAFYDVDDVPEVDAATYRLQVGGLANGKRVWTLDELHALPQTDQITRHICIEGWSAIGRRALCRLPEALRRGYDGALRVAALCRQLLDQHRYADSPACADAAHADLRRPGVAAEIRLSDEAAHADQAWLQESEAHRCDHRDE
jgi:hypothetical protein